MAAIKTKLIQIAGPLGGYRASRWLTRRVPKILMYHRFSAQPKPGYVDSKAFEQQVRYLVTKFKVLSLGELIDMLRRKERVPTNTAVITIDDGYRDFYEHAYPVLRKYDLPATLYVTTRFIDGDFWLWPDKVRYILANSSNYDTTGLPDGPVISSRNPDEVETSMLWAGIVEYLLSVCDSEKWKWIDLLAEKKGIEVPVKPIEKYRGCSWNEIREMSKNRIEIGGHTRTHPSLTKVRDENLSSEISGCFEDIAARTSIDPVSFCYPNGLASDFSVAVKQKVIASGYKGAVIAYYDNHLTGDVYQLGRFSVDQEWFQFLKSANGVEALTRYCYGSYA